MVDLQDDFIFLFGLGQCFEKRGFGKGFFYFHIHGYSVNPMFAKYTSKYIEGPRNWGHEYVSV